MVKIMRTSEAFRIAIERIGARAAAGRLPKEHVVLLLDDLLGWETHDVIHLSHQLSPRGKELLNDFFQAAADLMESERQRHRRNW